MGYPADLTGSEAVVAEWTPGTAVTGAGLAVPEVLTHGPQMLPFVLIGR